MEISTNIARQFKRHHILFCFAFTLFVFFLFSLQSTLAQTPPYPPSPVIAGIAWDSPSTVVRKASGSDNWPMTWALDDNLYTIWGDGWGFENINVGPKISHGVSRIEDPQSSFQAFDVFEGDTWGSNGKWDCKSYGIISINGVLYAWVGPSSSWTSSMETRLAWSNDLGRTWQLSSNVFFKHTDGFSLPTFLNFGKNYDNARDTYVYSYAYDASSGSGGPYHKINLARVPKEQISNRAAYEFFTGLDTDSNPLWSKNVALRMPVFTDLNTSISMPSAIYHTATNRYLLVVPHGSPAVWGIGTGGLGIFDSPEPWGPWTTVEYTNSWMGSSNMFFANFPTKWVSSDGKTMYLVFTGFGSDAIAKDAYQHIRGVLALYSSENLTPLSPTGLTIR